MKNNPISKNTQGYALLDVALALTIFAFAVTSLAVLLDRIVDTSTEYSRDRLLQSAMDSFMTETKRKPVREMTGEFYDENLDVTFRAEVEPLELANVDGQSLKDLYRLKIVAEYDIGGRAQSEESELYIYQPDRK